MLNLRRPPHIFSRSQTLPRRQTLPLGSYQIPHGDWTLFERHHTILTKCFHFGRPPSMFGQHLPFDRNIDSKKPEKVKHHRTYMRFRLLWISLLIFCRSGDSGHPTSRAKASLRRNEDSAEPPSSRQARRTPQSRRIRQRRESYGRLDWGKDRQHRQKQPGENNGQGNHTFCKNRHHFASFAVSLRQRGKKTGHAAVKER